MSLLPYLLALLHMPHKSSHRERSFLTSCLRKPFVLALCKRSELYAHLPSLLPLRKYLSNREKDWTKESC